MIEEEMKEKTKETKVKLLLIKEILIYADKMKIKLPDDVVSKLLKESIPVLKILIDQGYDLKVAYYLDFVIQANIEGDKLKKQILDEIVEAGQNISSYSCPSMEKFHRYIDSVIIFSTLEPTRKQLLAYVQTMKDRRENSSVISIINQLHNYEFSNQEILSLLRPAYDPDTDNLNNLISIEFILRNDGTYPYLKEKSHENLLKYLSWAMEEREIASLLEDENFCSMEMDTKDFDQILTKIKNQKPPFLELETEILLEPNFSKLVNFQNMSISSFLEFSQEREEKKDLLSLEVFDRFLADCWYDFYIDTAITDVPKTMFELSKEIASVVRKTPEEKQEKLIGIVEEEKLVRLLEKEKDLKNGERQLLHLFEFLSQLDDFNFHYLTEILENSNMAKSMNSISELLSFLRQLTQLEPSILELFHHSITNSNLQVTSSYDTEIYQVYPYLIEKLSNPVTKLERKQLETALSVLNNAEYGKRRKDALDINWEIIDLIFQTKFNWQRQNIYDVAVESYPSELKSDTYLMGIKYMMEMKQRDKKDIPPQFLAPSYELYQQQIDEVDRMLKKLTTDRPIVKRKK